MPTRLVTARIVGTPAPGLAVWKVDEDVAGDLEDAPPEVTTGDLVVLEVARDGFRWVVHRLVEHIAEPNDGRRVGASTTARHRRPPTPHAHPARPPGTVLIAWLPFTNEPGDEGDVPGKHRPVVVVRSPDPELLRVRPLYDPGSAVGRKVDGPRLQAWRAAGLDKPSVAGPATDIPTRWAEQEWGRLSPIDLRQLGIDVPGARRR